MVASLSSNDISFNLKLTALVNSYQMLVQRLESIPDFPSTYFLWYNEVTLPDHKIATADPLKMGDNVYTCVWLQNSHGNSFFKFLK